jgi:mono/diheme cytochrome c family protein
MKKILKWSGMVGGGILAILLLALFGLSFSVSARLDRRYDVAPEPVVIPTNRAAIEEGKRLVTIHCAGCHGDNLGGADFFNDPALAVIDAPNLTPGQGGAGGALRRCGLGARHSSRDRSNRQTLAHYAVAQLLPLQ